MVGLALLACDPAPPAAPPEPVEAVAPKPATPEAAVVRHAVDLNARIDEFTRNRPDATDGEFYVYRSPEATVHMHVIGVGQMCPLHIHRTTREATIVVRGNPEVVHVHGEDDTLVRSERRVPPGQLVYSPPFTGHQWTNVDDAPQGNLVIASPKFDGNLYLHPDDPRMLPGPPATLVDPTTAMATVDGSGWADLHLGAHSLHPEQLRLAVVRDTLKLHDDPTRDSVLYVAVGTGRIGGQPLKPGLAVVLQGGAAETLEADEPMAVWVFTPEASGSKP